MDHEEQSLRKRKFIPHGRDNHRECMGLPCGSTAKRNKDDLSSHRVEGTATSGAHDLEITLKNHEFIISSFPNVQVLLFKQKARMSLNSYS